MKKNITVTIGEILKEEFLKELGISAYKLALAIGVSNTMISKIIKGYSGISPDMALRLSKFFGTSPEYWLNMSTICELLKAEERQKEDNLNIVNYKIFLEKNKKQELKEALLT